MPRAVLRRNKPILLDGEWHFALDPDDEGIPKKWYMGHNYTNTAHWPGSIEHHIEQLKDTKENKTWQGNVVAWYERDFPLPQLVSSGAPSMLQLTFGACGYETRVWLNGIQLRTVEGEDVHFGKYTSFSYELKESTLRLFNRLTVRIADTMDADITRGKQESNVYKRGGIWYQTYTGAVRSTGLSRWSVTG